jgi:hypothetical protein
MEPRFLLTRICPTDTLDLSPPMKGHAMRNITCLSVFVCLLLTSAPCDAGGFFRSVPEVGEWARYDITQVHTSDFGKPSEISEVLPGSMVVKCVGEEVIDERRCLWIETCTDMKLAAEIEFSAVSKVLVPADELPRGALTNNYIRGWQQEGQGEPIELSSSGDLSAAAAASTARMLSRTIVVNDEEIELSYSETAPLPVREDENGIWRLEMTIWPHDDLAFGVASMDVVSNQLNIGEISSTTLNETRYDLVETGTGAVSDLPDHN